MVTDILDFDSLIRGYIIDVIRQYYPDMDTSLNSPFDDIFIKPMIKLLRPFLNRVSRAELKSNLANAQYLTESEMDEIGEGNYFMSRIKGKAATTIETLTFTNLNLEDENFAIKIPAGSTFATTSGKEFQTKSTITLDAEAMRSGYNKYKMVYEIDIPITANDIGTDYNVSAGEIMICKSFFSNSLVSCVNKVEVTDGRNQETNEKYAERIRNFYISRQLGTSPGYREFVLETFEEVSDLYVSGYKDEYMNRDLLCVYDEEKQKPYYKHVGGCVDLYLKGCIYDDNEIEVILNNNILLLDCNFSDLVDKDNVFNNIQIYNLTDATKTVELSEVSAVQENEFFGENTGKTKVIIDNKDNTSYQDGILNNMKIVYSYKDGEDVINGEKYFQVGLTECVLASPVKSINFMTDITGQMIPDFESKIEVIKNGIAGTTDENCVAILKNLNEYYNGVPIKINYTSNKTLRLLKSALELENNRIITADVIGKEATSVPVNLKFRFKIKAAYRNMDRKLIETRIKASVNSFFENYQMGDEIQESDLVAWLYVDVSTKDIIEYIELPFKVFYIPNNALEDIPMDGTQISKGGILPIKSIEYPFLNASKFEVEMF